MPANLTPMYHRAEAEFRRADTAEERVRCLEEMLRLIPKHKGTDHLQGDLRAKLKEARADLETERSAPKKTRSYRIPRQGAGQVIVLGGPNSGKSRVLTELTKATTEVADYPYTTHEPIPGMMAWEDVRVQLIDTPPISDTLCEPYLIGMTRAADAALLCFDGSSDDGPDAVAEVVSQLRDRKTVLSTRTGFSEDDFSIVEVRTLVVVTRGSAPGLDARQEFLRELYPEVAALPQIEVDLDDEADRDRLREAIYHELQVIRLYTKKPGQKGEYVDPYTIPVGGTVEDLAYRIHNDLGESVKFAKVWGESARDGQSVGRDHVLADQDLVELHS